MRLWFALMLVACWKPQQHVRNRAAVDELADKFYADFAPPTRLGAVRPPVDLSAVLPDPTERARWPLPASAHPVFEPHFDIVDALAQPGTSWIDLCGRGIQNRHLSGNGQDRVEYLRAWCSAANKNPDDAVFRLAQLRSSVVLGIPDALPFDISNILADTGDADAAEHLLAKHALDHDVSLLDTLVATYIEVGRLGAAQEIDRLATDADHAPAQNRTCARLARSIVTATPTARVLALEHLAIVNKSNGARVTNECVAVQHELACWIQPRDKCEDFFKERGIDASYVYLVRAYEDWPRGTAEAEQWQGTSVDAMVSFPITGSELMFVAAAEMVMRTSDCDGERLGLTLDRARHMREDSRHDHTLDARFDALIATITKLLKYSPDACKRELAAPGR